MNALCYIVHTRSTPHTYQQAPKRPSWLIYFLLEIHEISTAQNVNAMSRPMTPSATPPRLLSLARSSFDRRRVFTHAAHPKAIAYGYQYQFLKVFSYNKSSILMSNVSKTYEINFMRANWNAFICITGMSS